MIHDPERVARIRSEIQRVVARAVLGESRANDPPFRRQLELARRGVAEVEKIFLRNLDGETRIPPEEARWLAVAEDYLRIQVERVDRRLAELDKHGSGVKLI